MIKSWRIGNFKSIRETTDLELAPLTIFTGPNSSGKSAVIKSILMVAQSLGSSAWEEPLILNGRWVYLGHPEDILHYGYNSPLLTIGFVIDQNGGQIRVDTTIETYPDNVEKRLNLRVNRVETRLETGERDARKLAITRSPTRFKKDDIESATPTVQSQIGRGIFDYRLDEPPSAKLDMPMEEILSTSLSNFLPGRLLVRVHRGTQDVIREINQLLQAINALIDPRVSSPELDWDQRLSDEAAYAFKLVSEKLPQRYGREREHYITEETKRQDRYLTLLIRIYTTRPRLTIRHCQSLIRQTLNTGQIRDLYSRLGGTLPRLQQITDPNDLELKRLAERTELDVRPFPTQYSYMMDRVKYLFGSRLYYLGPLRDDPRVVYAIPSRPNTRDVGLKGEFTAAMLETHAQREISYPVPPHNFTGEFEIKTGSLIEAVQIWLLRMGLAERVDAEEASKIGYRLMVSLPEMKEQLDLMSVGVGVSQVLPNLVMGLLAQENSVLIFEQPEVHLHPKVQSLLGDFFLGLGACNKQCIVETHSEHLINRVRRRIAESEQGQILDQTRVYFVERRGLVSQFQSVALNQYGAIMEWPKDFFDEGEEEASAILNAALAKHQRIRQSAPEDEVK